MAQNDDDQLWDLLAGKEAPKVSDIARRHAQALRDAVLRRHEAIDSEIDVDASLSKFQTRLERERPFNGASAEPSGPRNDRSLGLFRLVARWFNTLRGPQIALALALVLTVGVVLRVGFQGQPDFVVRDYAVGERNYVKVDDQKAHQTRLAAELKELGLTVEVLDVPDVNGALVVQATLPPQADSRLIQILARHGLRGFGGGELDVGFQKR
jgi:hypothetical protein